MVEVQTLGLEGEENDLNTKMTRLVWTDDETKMVGNFLKGNQIPASSLKEERDLLWTEVKAKTDIEPEETLAFIKRVKSVFPQNSSLSEEQNASDSTDEDESVEHTPSNEQITNEEEYIYTVKKTAQVAQEIVADSLIKFGIWDADDSRRIKAYGGLRSKDKKTYAQSEVVGPEVSGKGYIKPSEGGPVLVESIYAPRYENSKNTSDNRTKRSLGHEIQHVTRILSNKNLWKGYEEEAETADLRKPDSDDKKKYVGGYYVGSNMQGSEAVGELFARVIELKLGTDNQPKISDLIPLLEDQVRKGVNKLEKKIVEGKKPSTRYLPAKFALLDHLKGLQENEFADIEAIDLVALGSFGYVTYEKIPELIKLGVIDQKKFRKMRQVVRNVSDWLTSPNEDGFRITPQNT